MNTNKHLVADAIQSHNAALENAELEKQQALRDYVELLGDPSRTSPEDRQKFSAAAKLIGKSHEDIRKDAQAIESAHAFAADAADYDEAATAAREAKDALREFEMEGGRLKMVEQIAQVHNEKRAAAEATAQRLKNANAARSSARKLRNEHPALAVHMPEV